MSEAAEATLEVVESLGIKVPIDRSVMSDTMRHVIRKGEYEKGEAKNLYRIVEPGERVLELGGGIGFLSSVIGRLQCAEKIVTVEANPELIPLIHTTHRLNGVEAEVIHAAAVGDEAIGSVSFSLDLDFWASGIKARKAKMVRTVVEVPALALGALVRTYRPTMLIADVEGTEIELFQRPSDIDGVQKVLVEVHDKMIGPRGIKQLFDFFSAAGFYVDVRLTIYGVVLFRRLEQD